MEEKPKEPSRFRALSEDEQYLLQYLMESIESCVECYARNINDANGLVPHKHYVAYALHNLNDFVSKGMDLEAVERSTGFQLLHWAFLKMFSELAQIANNMTANVEKLYFARFVVKAVQIQLCKRLEMDVDCEGNGCHGDNPFHYDTPGEEKGNGEE
jgi:hypothetical protein